MGHVYLWYVTATGFLNEATTIILSGYNLPLLHVTGWQTGCKCGKKQQQHVEKHQGFQEVEACPHMRPPAGEQQHRVRTTQRITAHGAAEADGALG